MSSPEPAARPGAQQTPGAASSPPADARADAFGDDSEKLSGEALDRLVDAFHRGAARGSVYDRYSLGETLGARHAARPRAQAQRARARAPRAC